MRTALRLPPAHEHDHQLCIGAHASRGNPVMLDSDERRRHLYVIGQTGTGKSTLFLNLIQRPYSIRMAT
jgi:DNA helicase HerA-like ATPase